MKLSTYHAHSHYSDGKSSLEEMVVAAIEAGCPEIGFSDHSHIPGLSWCMDAEKIEEYHKAVCALREKYAGKIKIFVGIEQDTYSTTPTDSYDYVLGSVHAVMTEGGRRDVDASATFVRETIDKYFGGDPYAYCEAYYDEVGRLYEKTHCDIIGHFDLVTKYIEKDPLFSEDHPRYVAARDAALRKLLSTSAVFEANTGAISRGYRTTPYPHPDVVKRIVEAGKPMVVNSDSHCKDTVNFKIDSVGEELRARGVKLLCTLDEVLNHTRK